MSFWIPNNWLLRQQVARADFEAQKDQQAESEPTAEGRPWWMGPLNWYGEQAQRGMDFAKGFGSAFTGSAPRDDSLFYQSNSGGAPPPEPEQESDGILGRSHARGTPFLDYQRQQPRNEPSWGAGFDPTGNWEETTARQQAQREGRRTEEDDFSSVMDRINTWASQPSRQWIYRGQTYNQYEQQGIPGIDQRALELNARKLGIPNFYATNPDNWKALSDEQKKSLVREYVADPYSKNPFASSIEMAQEAAAESPILAPVAGTISAIGTPFAKKSVGLEPSKEEWIDSAINIALMVVPGLYGLGGIAKTAAKGIMTGAGAYSATQTVQNWDNMTNPERAMAIGMDVALIASGKPDNGFFKKIISEAKPVLRELATSEVGGVKLPGGKSVPKKGTIVPKEGTTPKIETPARNIEQPGIPVEPVQIAPPTRATEPLIGGTSSKPPVEPPKPPPAATGAGGIEPPKPGLAGNIRLSKFPTEVHDDLNRWAEDAGRVATRRRGTRSHQVTLEAAQEIADKTGGNPSKIAKQLGQAYNAEEAKAIDGMLIQAQNELKRVKTLVDAGQNTTGNILRVKAAQDKLSYWVAIATSARAEAGRALESFKIINKAMKSQDTKVMESVLKRVGGRENIEKVLEASRGLDWDNPVAINNFIRSMNRPRLKDYIFEVYVNSILSGPKTHIVNTLSNAMTATISPLETMGGAVIEKGLARLQGRQSARYLGEARYEAAGALQGFQSGVRGALHTLRHGIRPDAMTKLEFRPSAFSGKFGRVVNFPSTALEAADEFFYNINYRMALNKQAYRAAKARGLSGQKLLDDMADTIANPTDNFIEAAAKQAQQRLFRQEAGKTTQKLMAMREDQPILRFFLPFLRTPVNLVKFGIERSPLGFLNPKLIANLRAKNPQAAEQLANAFIGTAVATALYFYVKDGRITGAPPTSSSARDKFYAEGKQPYAIKIGNVWVSYQRLEPFNQMLSQLAALVGALENDDEETAGEKLGAVAKDIGYNFASQTYMSGISDLIDALSDPERYGTSYANRLAGSLAVPYSALSRTVAQMADTTIRKPTNPWEGIQANVPGLSQNVPASTSLKGVERERQSPAWSPISVTKDKEQPSGEWNIGGKKQKQRPQFNWSGGIKSRPVFVWK